MRVLFIHPFGSNWIEGTKDKVLLANRSAPIGILSIAGFLMKRGVEVDILNCTAPVKLTGTEETMRRVQSFRPTLIGFTTTTSSFLDAYRQAEEIKRIFPDIGIVFGGVHVSALREIILESFPCIDFIVSGEGEKAMAGLACGEKPETIQGLIFREGKQVRSNGLRTDLCELDKLPFPAYRKLEGFPKFYEPPLFNCPRVPAATIISSRGCPYQCSYCDRSVFRRSFRFNSAGYLYEHMVFLKTEFGVRHIFFYDDLFTFHRSRIEEFCGLLRKRPLHMTFNCAVRLGHIDDDLLKMLKTAGCWMVSLGIESGDPEILLRHKSKVSPDEMRTAIKQIQKNGLRAKGLFMMGLPGETESTIKRTADFIEKLELDDMNMTKFTPFPGAPVYKTIHEEGTFKEDWELMNCLNFVFVPKGIESKERLEELYKQFIKRFYTSKNWIRKFGPLMFKSPHSTYRIIKNLPGFLKIRKDFEPH
ncbi:MAG: cobalamin B12-binding domain-containing protein [Nitrospirae bacterium]|nr:cobalamin B12-binding domain-containing protein [Nitrospirota bacterium]